MEEAVKISAHLGPTRDTLGKKQWIDQSGYRSHRAEGEHNNMGVSQAKKKKSKMVPAKKSLSNSDENFGKNNRNVEKQMKINEAINSRKNKMV